MLTLERTDLTVLDDVGASHAAVHVAAGVVVCIPLATPRTCHTCHTPENTRTHTHTRTEIQTDELTHKHKGKKILSHTQLGRSTHT